MPQSEGERGRSAASRHNDEVDRHRGGKEECPRNNLRRSRSPYDNNSRGSEDRRRHRQRHSSSQSQSWRKDRKPNISDRQAEVLPITGDDASFILGVGGRTKRKLSRVCGAELNVTERNGQTVLEVKGTLEALEKALLYVDFVMQQRVGPVELKVRPEERNDMTLMTVPHACVGYVTGRKGQGLRSVEEEWNTLMFFTDLSKNASSEKERLAIFGTQRARRGSELKVMSAVEQKMPGYVDQPKECVVTCDPDFATDIVPIDEADYSYALGSKGATRKKLARASGAIIEYVGRYAYIAGNLAERERGRQYLQWLVAQRVSQVRVCVEDRDDVLVIKLKPDCVAYVTGTKGNNLRRVEDQTDTFIFLDNEGRDHNYERLLIFGYSAENRRRAARLIDDRIAEKDLRRTRNVDYYDRRGNRHRRHYRSRSSSSYHKDGGRHKSTYDSRRRSRSSSHRGRYQRSRSPLRRYTSRSR